MKKNALRWLGACFATAVFTAAILICAYLALMAVSLWDLAGTPTGTELAAIAAAHWNYLIILLGTMTGQVFSVPGCYGNSVPFVRRMVPGQSRLLYNRVDFWVSVLLGPLVVYLLVEPTTAYLSLGAGLGWNYVVKGTVVAVTRVAGGNAHAAPTLTATSEPGRVG